MNNYSSAHCCICNTTKGIICLHVGKPHYCSSHNSIDGSIHVNIDKRDSKLNEKLEDILSKLKILTDKVEKLENKKIKKEKV